MHTRPVDTVQRHKSMALQLPPISECGKTLGEDQALKNVKPEQDRKQTSKVTYPRSVIKAYLSWKQKNWRIKLNQKQNIPILLSRVDIVRRGYSFSLHWPEYKWTEGLPYPKNRHVMGNWWQNRGRYLPETCDSQSDCGESSCKGVQANGGCLLYLGWWLE
jgi:hypothetical protein